MEESVWSEGRGETGACLALLGGAFVAAAVACPAMTPKGRPGSNGTPQDRDARVRDQLEAQAAAGVAPGIQYVVVDRDSRLFEHAAGWADLAGRRRLEPTTTMMTYSMTKAVTAAAVLQLVERGAVSLDAPVKGVLGDIPYDDRLTIRHLLAQTSGIPNPIPLKWVHLPEEHAAYDERATLARVLAANGQLRFAPGERYAYSNISYWLLGQVVERVTGARFQDYVAENVFRRLGLPPAAIGFVIPSPEHHAKGYLPRWSFMNFLKPFLIDRKFVGEYEGRWLHVNDNYLDGAAFGGIVASAGAVGSFLQDQLRDEPILLGRETRRLQFTPQRNNAGELVDMTLGWHVGRSGGTPYFFKEGGGAGFHGEMRVYPSPGIASVAIANSGAFDVKAFLDAADRDFLP
jgi:CubicO group peptidase (beta-lactamase class C family)